MVRIAILVAASFMGLSACSKTEAPLQAGRLIQAKVQVDLTTPDKALKSYWAVRDSVRAKHSELFSQGIAEYRSAEDQMSSVADGVLAKTFASDVLPIETFSRDLIDVKVESESRAAIVAVIKNSSPIPAGAELSKFDEERRRDGERYILERSQTGWRVSEIWEWSDYLPKNDWKKTRPGDGKLHVPSLVYEGV